MNLKFAKSTRRNKKYVAMFELNGKQHRVHFGDTRYAHYKDNTPLKLYKKMDHLDERRRKKYIARASGIKDKLGRLTKNNPLSSNYWAMRYLW